MGTKTDHLAEQFDWHWYQQLRPRLDGLTDDAYDSWMSGVRGLTSEDLATPIGPAEGPWADKPMVDLVLHINREVIHHGAEIALLRDLYAHAHPKEN